MTRLRIRIAGALAAAAALVGTPLVAHAAWEPQKPVEFIIPAGTGGGADQMARLITGLAEKHNLTPRPIIAINKSGGAGAEGFLYVKGKKGDAHTIIITLSNLFTTPMSTGVPFNWKDLTPVARLALDEFVLWVNASTPYTTAKDYITAAKEKGPMKMGGTGTAQEDQIITLLLQQRTGAKFTYVPFKGGGEVCVNLVGGHVDSTVNNPIECVSHWRATPSRVRPLAIFDEERSRIDGWTEIPTVKEALGADIDYLMLRGIFGPPDMPKEAMEWYQGFLQKIMATPEWKDFMTKGAFKQSWLTGPEFVKWLGQTEALHRELMEAGGLLKK